jgi:hypothetical protein
MEKSNYRIITDEVILKDFITDWLPELTSDETYYLCLFARSKYAKNEDGSNKFPHIKTDKSQLKRFVSNKRNMIDKIRQLECAVGSYKTKDGDDVPQESLALYITPNPRSQKRALFNLQRKLIDILDTSGSGYNVNQEAISAIQKSKSRTVFVDFDIDDFSPDHTYSVVSNILTDDCFDILETRGGCHLLVKAEIATRYNKMWYNLLTTNLKVDIKGDNMIPVPGTHQGGFTPKMF